MNRRFNSAMPKSLMDDEVIITQSTTGRPSLQGNGGSGKSLTAVRDEGFGHQDPDSERFEPLLDSAAAAKLLRIHPKTLQKMARSGTVPGHRIGDLWRFRVSELDSWIREAVNFQSPLVP
jgi:excisionase family DNA binding protein